MYKTEFNLKEYTQSTLGTFKNTLLSNKYPAIDQY